MYRIGIDAGSKTLKLVVLDESGAIVYSTYMRHRANIARTLREAIHDLNWRHGPMTASIAMTGSAAIEVARLLGIPFVQEVVATTHAVRTLVPDADVAIELGGEDAKIIYLGKRLEQRMNASCAGGTGGFIDTIAYMLGVKSSQMSQLAFGASRSYPIASRCAVFAQTDVRPLLNAGASKGDIAASVFDAVVRQTLGGLACGRPIRGNVVFLGGPLEHMPYLVHAFRRALDLTAVTGAKPADAHLFTVRGTALLSDDEAALGHASVVVDTAELEEAIESMGAVESDLERLEPLFSSEEELEEFRARHDRAEFARRGIYEAKGPLYLGIDAGSTTLKLVVLDEDARIVHSTYESIRGDLIETLREALGELYRRISVPAYLPHAKPRTWIARAVATGYGEDLLRAAFGVDAGIVETAAHLRSARQLCPDLDFLLDIGGQDMKALWVRHGMVVDAALNEACSSGCGAFIEGTAAALKSTPHRFAADALMARDPIDLGTKCTVFMSSRVKHAQKTGAPVDDIAAGVAYSVVKNALHRIIGDDRMPRPGDRVVVQGGTFRSDAVLRAFESLTGIEVVRPAQSHLMGAIGCALIARDAADDGEGARSTLIGPEELAALVPKRFKLPCTGCANGCTLSLVTFDEEGARHFISDNKCERGLDELKRRTVPAVTSPSTPTPPNVVALEQRLIASFGDLAQDGPRGRVRMGLMDSMALYAHRPFWHTTLGRLGFSIVVPKPGCEGDRASEAWETVPSESVCYPAKTAHARYFSLCEKGCDAVFMPRFARSNHCPVQTGYADALAGNVESARYAGNLAPLVSPLLANYKPQRFANDDESIAALLDALNDVLGEGAPAITRSELMEAIECGIGRQDEVTRELERRTDEALQWLAADPSRHGIVLAGRPYHMDEALLHGIDRELARLGFAVFAASGLGSMAGASSHLEGANPWFPAKRLVWLARIVAANPQLDAVFLQSFGCGFEAVSIEEAAEVLDAVAKPCTVLKVDDISDLAHIRIRLRTLAAAIDMREHGGGRDRGTVLMSREPQRDIRTVPAVTSTASFLGSIAADPLGATDLECARRRCVKDVCFTANVMAARVIAMLEADPSITRVELPDVCETCLTQAVPRIVERACGRSPEYVWVPWDGGDWDKGTVLMSHWGSWDIRTVPLSQSPPSSRPRIGIVGNPLLVFEPFMNDHIVAMLDELGCQPVLPDPVLVTGEDVRYLDQLAAFEEQGIRDVIYLLSFGCLKGHVSARGALRQLHERFPALRITVIDFDPEGSALNRENRIRLAVEAARE